MWKTIEINACLLLGKPGNNTVSGTFCLVLVVVGAARLTVRAEREEHDLRGDIFTQMIYQKSMFCIRTQKEEKSPTYLKQP